MRCSRRGNWIRWRLRGGRCCMLRESCRAFLATETAAVAVMRERLRGTKLLRSWLRAERARRWADGAGEAAPRITKFTPKPRKIGTGYLAKAKPAKFAVEAGGAKRFPAPKFGVGAKPGFGSGLRGGAFKGGAKDGSKARGGAGAGPDRGRRPFSKAKAGGFDKPWEEEKAKRLAAARRPSEVREDAGAGGPGGAEAKPKFAGKTGFGGKPKFGGKPAFGGEGRPARREFVPRGEGGDARPVRKTFSKPGTFGRKRDERAGGFEIAQAAGRAACA